MRIGRILWVSSLLVVLAAGCWRGTKGTPTKIPPQATAPPVLAPTPTPTPTPTANPPATGSSPSTSKATDTSDSKTRRTSKKSHKGSKPQGTKSTTQTTAQNNHPAVAVSHPQKPPSTDTAPTPTPSPISEPMSNQEEAHQKETTEQLLQYAEGNLRRLTADLNDEQKAMVDQVRVYMAQSRTATAEEDLVRAHNLALKARLLSDDLAKH